MQIFITADSWFVMTVIQATVASGSYTAHATCNLAYLPELSKNKDDSPPITAMTKIWETVIIIGCGSCVLHSVCFISFAVVVVVVGL